MRFDGDSLELLNDTAHALYAHVDIDSFLAALMVSIPKIIPCDHTSYIEINMNLDRTSGAFDSPEGQRLLLTHTMNFEKYMGQHPLINYFQQSEQPDVKKISDFMTVAEWHKTDIYHKFYRYYDISHQMIGAAGPQDNVIFGVTLNRQKTDFTEEERARYQFILPHILQAYDNLQREEALKNKLETSALIFENMEIGLIELDRDLEIRDITPMAAYCLSLFFPSVRDALPNRLYNWANNIKKSLKGMKVEPLVIENSAGRLILRTYCPPTDGNIMVYMEQLIYGTSSDALKTMGLTGREADILFWLAQGKTNPEIAIIFKSSIRTVQKHLEAILRKLNVTNRTQAAIKAIETLRISKNQGCG